MAKQFLSDQYYPNRSCMLETLWTLPVDNFKGCKQLEAGNYFSNWQIVTDMMSKGVTNFIRLTRFLPPWMREQVCFCVPTVFVSSSGCSNMGNFVCAWLLLHGHLSCMAEFMDGLTYYNSMHTSWSTVTQSCRPVLRGSKNIQVDWLPPKCICSSRGFTCLEWSWNLK